MNTSFKVLLRSSVMIAISAPALAQSAPPLEYARQGWAKEERQAFYTTSQGSHMIQYPWFKALRRLDKDEPFGADQLQRYGYLVNEGATSGLPVGFVIDEQDGKRYLGMTCAACHTAEIEYQKAGVPQIGRASCRERV